MDQRKFGIADKVMQDYSADDLFQAAKNASETLAKIKTGQIPNGQQFEPMATLRIKLKDKLQAYLKGTLTAERLVELISSSDKVFRSVLSAEEDFMDVDEGHSEFNHTSELSQSLVDAIWLHRFKLDESEVQIYHSKILALIQPLIDHKVIQKSQLMVSLEVATLGELGLVNQNQFTNRSKQYYTREFFEQQKFNLLREENEGFSKLLLEINQENLNESNYQIVIGNIQKLIGYFSLDPNRVLELLLCAFQFKLSNLTYLKLLREFGNQHAVSQLIGFKFQNLQGDCKSLFDLTALLIKHEIVNLPDIWGHFETKEEEAEDEIEKLLSQQAKSLEYQYGMLFKTIMDNNRFEEEMKSKKAEQTQIDEARSAMHKNYKLRLLQSCIDMNDWDTADEICNSIYSGKLDLTLSKGLMTSVFAAIKWFVEPLYRQIDPTQSFQNVWSTLKSKAPQQFTDNHPSSVKQATTPELLFEGLQRILNVITVHIAFDEIAFTKVLRVMIHAIQMKPELKSQAATLSCEFLFPALALTSENYYLEHLLWQVLRHADFRQRYAAYSKMLQKTYLSYPCLLAKLINVHRESKMWASRLNTDQMRQMSKQLSKIATGNALIVFELIVSNAKSYDNMIDAQIQAIANCQDLALDIMAFTITKHLADTNEETLDDEANVQQWLNYLTKFAASFFKKYHNVEILGLLTYLLHRQREEENFLLGYVLNQIIAKMFGWSDQIINQLPANQLNVIAAGFVLMLEGKNQSKEVRKNNKSTEALIQLFWDSATKGHDKFAMRLMIQLAQYTQYVQNMLETGTEKLTLVSRLYDRVQVYFLHLVDTLNFLATPEKKFSQLLTESPAKVLSFDYRLPPQYVFHILRCSLPPIYKLKPEQFADCVTEFQKVLDYNLQSRITSIQNNENAQENDYWDELQFVQVKKDMIWKCMKPEVYFIFWYMSLQNLLVCEQAYKEEIKRMSDQIEELKNPKSQAQTTLSGQKALSSSELQKKVKKETERLVKVQKTLQKEQEVLTKNQTDTFEYLKQKLPSMFEVPTQAEQAGDNIHDSTNAFLQYCLYPRLLHSAKDALYAFHFFKVLHRLKVPNFKILKFLIAILKCVMPAMYCCSEAEAENLGIFFLELFGLLNHWSKKSVWDKECAGYSGFAKNFGSDQCISHEEFVQIIGEGVNKRFAGKMLCLEPSPKMYMKTRCSLIILNRMSPVFPNSYKNAETIANRLQALVDAQKQISKDLYTLASRCNEQLKAKIKTFPEYIKEQQQREQQEKQAEEAKAKAAKQVKQGDKPKESKENSRTVGEKPQSKSDSFAQPKDSNGKDKGKDDRETKTPAKKPSEVSKNSDLKRSDDKQSDNGAVRHVSSQKSTRKEDQSSNKQAANQRYADQDKKSTPSQPMNKQVKDLKPSTSETDRQEEQFPQGLQSRARVKADDKQVQQNMKNQPSSDRQVNRQSSGKEPKEQSPNTVKKPENKLSETKSEQRPSQTPTASESQPLIIQPRSVTSFEKSKQLRLERPYQAPPQNIDYLQPKTAKRPRIDDLPPQKQELPRQQSFRDQDVQMTEPGRLKDVGYGADKRMGDGPIRQDRPNHDHNRKETDRNEREFGMMRGDKYDERDSPNYRPQNRRSRSPYYDDYNNNFGGYQRQENDRGHGYQQPYRKQFSGGAQMVEKGWMPPERQQRSPSPRIRQDPSPQGKWTDYRQGYTDNRTTSQRAMELSKRQASPPRVRPQGNYNDRIMPNKGNFNEGHRGQPRGGR